MRWRPVRDIRVRGGMRVSELVEQMEASGGFAAAYLGRAVSVLREVVRNLQ